MTSLERKHVLLLYPFIKCYVGLILGYTLFHWCCIESYDMLDVNEMLMIFLLPAIIAVGLIAIVLRPGIKLLYFSRRSGPFSHYLLTLFCLVIPNFVVQQYLETATGKLTVLDTITQYESKPKTKYYQVKHYCLAPSLAGEKRREYYSGKHQSRLHLEAYFAQPIYATTKDTLSRSDHYWLCTYYQQSINANESEENRILDRARFNQYVATDYPTTPFYKATYWEREGIVDKTSYFEDAVNKSPLERDGGSVLFIPHYDDFAHRSGKKGLWSFAAVMIGIGAYYFFILITRLKTEEEMEEEE